MSGLCEKWNWKREVGVIVWLIYHRAYPAWDVLISNLSSFRPTGLLFVRRSLQQSVPRDATAAAGVAADGSTCVGLKLARRLLKCSTWWWCKGGLRKSCGNDMFVVHLMKLHGKLVVRSYHCVTIEHVMGALCKFPPVGVNIILVRWTHLTWLHSTTKTSTGATKLWVDQNSEIN